MLDTDASDVAAGAVLSQLQEGQEKVIAYGSRAFSAEEKNYCVTRRELLAIVWSMENYRYYLYGKKFVVRTDHASLKWMLRVKEPKDQLARWIQRLSVFDFEIEHRPGKKHGNADALSRKCFRGGVCYHPGVPEAEVAPGTRFTVEELKLEGVGPSMNNQNRASRDGYCSDDCLYQIREEGESGSSPLSVEDSDTEGEAGETSIPTGLVVGLSHQEILDRQKDDPVLAEIRDRKLAGAGRLSRKELSAQGYEAKWWNARYEALEIKDDLLYYRWEDCRSKDGDRLRLATPRSMIDLVLSHLHDGKAAGHMGRRKTWGRALECPYYWPSMRGSVDRWIRKCKICQQRKSPPFSKRAPLISHQVGLPWERVAADIAGPFPITKRGNKYILVIQDYFSKWVEIFPLPDQKAETVATCLVDNVIARFGCIRELHTDRGSNFESQVLKSVCRLLGIFKTRTTGYHPRGDGMVERFNRTMESMLAAWTSTYQDDWDEHLALIGMAYRSAPHESTKETPNRMIFGKEVTLPVDLIMEPAPGDGTDDEPATYVEDLQERLQIIQAAGREHLTSAMITQKRHYDRNVRNIDYQAGDIVWLHHKVRKKGKSPKLTRSWKGPFLITAKLGDVTYRIQAHPRSKTDVVHADRLKLAEGVAASELGFKPDRPKELEGQNAHLLEQGEAPEGDIRAEADVMPEDSSIRDGADALPTIVEDQDQPGMSFGEKSKKKRRSKKKKRKGAPKVKTKEHGGLADPPSETKATPPLQIRTRCGRVINKPRRYDY